MNDTQQFQQLMDTYVEKVLKDLELGAPTEDQKLLLREMILQKVDRRIVSLIIEELKDQDFETLLVKLQESALTEDEETALFAQASDKIPDFPEKFAKNLEELRLEMIDDARDLKKAISDVN